MEEHALLLDCHQALVEPGPVAGLLGGGLDQLLAADGHSTVQYTIIQHSTVQYTPADGHLEAAVDDLTRRAEVVKHRGVEPQQ